MRGDQLEAAVFCAGESAGGLIRQRAGLQKKQKPGLCDRACLYR
jgi:hypothetical protein